MHNEGLSRSLKGIILGKKKSSFVGKFPQKQTPAQCEKCKGDMIR